LIASPQDYAAFLKTTGFFKTICPPSLKT
jgi:hypothetical protein